MRICIAAVVAATMVVPAKAQKWEHLADTPQMGWSTWNKFQGNISEEVIKGIADAMVESGLKDAGYTYINIDDWCNTPNINPQGAYQLISDALRASGHTR